MAGVQITGDFAALRKFQKKLQRLAEKKAMKAISTGAVPAIQEAVNTTANSGEDAYGIPHAPAKDGGVAFASLDGNKAKASGSGKGVKVSVTRKIARYMNRGRLPGTRPGGFMPPRMLIPPNNKSPIPPTWVEALVDSAEIVIDEKATQRGPT